MLREILPGWQVRYLADGLALAPPEGGAGGIRIRERQPLRPRRAVVAWARGQMQGRGELSVSPLERVTTLEGEFAALWTITAVDGDRTHQRAVGMIWGDYFCTQIDGITDNVSGFAAVAQAVRDLTYLHSLGLGELRRRRYLYAPPAGWRPYPRGLIAEWYAPGFPADHGFVSVFPARAGQETAASQLDRVLHEMTWFGFERTTTTDVVEVTSTDGTRGHTWEVAGHYRDGKNFIYKIAVLSDGRFHYPLRLECTKEGLEHHGSAFDDMVRSVQRLPTPIRAEPTVLFEHWST